MNSVSKIETVLLGYVLPIICSGIVIGILFNLVRGLARAGS